MPLPSSINDLSQTAGSNSPAGSESPSLIDDYLRTYASYIALLRDGAQNNPFNYAVGGGSANAITATYSPAITTLDDKTILLVKPASTNTGATTFSPNGLTAKPVVGLSHAALTGGEIVAQGCVCLQYNSSVGAGSWVLVSSTGGSWAYCRTNIVGTVTQTSSVPTGAIVETATNANGTYTKFADGTLICQGPMADFAVGAAAVATVSSSATFPALFINSTYYFTCFGAPNTSNDVYGFTGPNSKTTSAATAVYRNGATAQTIINNKYVAIGRWF